MREQIIANAKSGKTNLFFKVASLLVMGLHLSLYASDIPVSSETEKTELLNVNKAFDLMRQEASANPIPSWKQVTYDLLKSESPSKILENLYLDGGIYAMASPHLLAYEVPILRPVSLSFGNEDVSRIHNNPRFRYALEVLEAMAPQDRELLLGEHLRASLALFESAYQREVYGQSEWFSLDKLNAPMPLGLGPWANTDGTPTLSGLRLGTLALVHLAGQLEARTLHSEIVAISKGEIERRKFFYDETQVNTRAAVYALMDALYNRGVLAMAIKRTASTDSPIHEVIASKFCVGDYEEVGRIDAMLEPDPAKHPRGIPVHWFPVMTDEQFDAIVNAASK